MRFPARKLDRRLVALAFAVALALAGCGANDQHLSDSARVEIAPLVGQVRRAAASRDRAGTARALAALVQAVNTFRNAGDIGAAKAAEILGAADQVKSRLALVPAATTTTASTTTTEPEKDHGKGKNDDNGKGDGHGKKGND